MPRYAPSTIQDTMRWMKDILEPRGQKYW
jgi:hypothetical protein